jgi:hypothetical protein
MLRTEINMTDFVDFVQVAARDEGERLTQIDENTVFSRVEFRKYLELYLPERICWTSIGRVFNNTMERDFHRYYWAAKMSKDFIIMTNKTEFSYREIQGYFADKVILNYLNEMLLEAFHIFEHMLMTKGGQRNAIFEENVPERFRNISFLNEAKR